MTPNSWRLANQYAVPHTGVRRNGHYFRHPRGARAAMRAIEASGDTLRGAKIPPDAWDDLTIQANRSRTWKRHRRTQWHERYVT